MARDTLDGVREERSYRVRLVPSQGRIERHAHLKKFIYTPKSSVEAGTNSLHPLHPVAALKPSVLKKTGAVPEHVTMSPRYILITLFQ